MDEAKQKLGDLNAEIMAELLGLEDYDKRNHKSLCPFHREDTGSFVYNSKGYYFKCFGCGKGGNATDFPQQNAIACVAWPGLAGDKAMIQQSFNSIDRS